MEEIDGREPKPADNGYLSEVHAERMATKSKDLPDFDRSGINVLKAKKGKVVTQLQYAKQGIVTPEMEFIAIRENMRMQSISKDLEMSDDGPGNSLFRQHQGESLVHPFPKRLLQSSSGLKLPRGVQSFLVT